MKENKRERKNYARVIERDWLCQLMYYVNCGVYCLFLVYCLLVVDVCCLFDSSDGLIVFAMDWIEWILEIEILFWKRETKDKDKEREQEDDDNAREQEDKEDKEDREDKEHIMSKDWKNKEERERLKENDWQNQW